MARRRQLLAMISSERNRRRTSPPDLREQLDEHISWLQQRVGELDRELAQLTRAREGWKHTSDVLQSTPGVGPTFTATALACLPELGQLTHLNCPEFVGDSSVWNQAT